MSTTSAVCPVCGKVRGSSFTFNDTSVSGSTVLWGSNSGTATISAGAYIPNTTASIPWMFSAGHTQEHISIPSGASIIPSVSLMDMCYGTGECASKECPVCTFMIRPGDEHDCAKLANSVGKSGTISHRDLEDKFIALLTQLRKDAERLAGDYTLSLDEDGQPNAPWLAEVIHALKCATDEAAHVILD